jgi:hypothetical protein
MPGPELEYTMTIHRVHAEPLRFKLRRTADQMRNAGAAIENGLTAHYLGLILEGKLIVVPAHQIAQIEIEPAPKALIAHVIQDAEPYSAS